MQSSIIFQHTSVQDCKLLSQQWRYCRSNFNACTATTLVTAILRIWGSTEMGVASSFCEDSLIVSQFMKGTQGKLTTSPFFINQGSMLKFRLIHRQIVDFCVRHLCAYELILSVTAIKLIQWCSERHGFTRKTHSSARRIAETLQVFQWGI